MVSIRFLCYNYWCFSVENEMRRREKGEEERGRKEKKKEKKKQKTNAKLAHV